MNKKVILHLLPNAHLDPVWLWDWREGMNEAVSTFSTVLDLMDEYPELTFVRGEAVIYRHLQRARPDLFLRIREFIEAGRWDVVGGTWVQPDSNLSQTETLCRHFEVGLDYFEKELGVRPRISWQADSFGHPAGWPNILRAFGMEGFLFTRPLRGTWKMEQAAFWWQGDNGDRLLSYRPHWRSYCTGREFVPEALDSTLAAAIKHSLRNVALPMGMGDHGGGPTRRQIHDVMAWRERHPEVEVRFSTMHHFFDVLMKEVRGLSSRQVPVHHGELGYCLRGCYSSVQKFKSLFRQAESSLVAGEAAQSFLTSLGVHPQVELAETWNDVLFNSFHDILPGSSIERAIEEQMAWTAGAVHEASRAQFHALEALARRIDTRVPKPVDIDSPAEVPFLIWNPLPRPFRGQVELEGSLDYRPFFHLENQIEKAPFLVRDAGGKSIPFQEIATEHRCMPNIPWRKRVVVPVELPALGWKVVRLGLANGEKAKKASGTVCWARTGEQPSIGNGQWSLSISKKSGLIIRKNGKEFLTPGRDGLRVRVVRDEFGAWGGMNEERDAWCLDKVLEEWRPKQWEILESGPHRAALWIRWQGRRSWLDLTFHVRRDVPSILVHGRMLWNERSARVQLSLPSLGEAVCDVPGGTCVRQGRGQVPVGRWFYRANARGERVGMVSDVLSDVDFLPKETRLTIARASRYGDDVPTRAQEKSWLPAVDCGELKFRLLLFSDRVNPDHMADEFLWNPIAMPVPASSGDLATEGSLGRLEPDTMRLLAAETLDNGGIRVRVQNRSTRKMAATLTWAGERRTLGELGPQQIRTWEIK